MNLAVRLSMVLTLTLLGGCKKFLEVPAPTDKLGNSTVFSSNVGVNAALLGIYTQMASYGSFSGDYSSVTMNGGLSSDELTNYSTDPTQTAVANNALIPQNDQVLFLWSGIYTYIYYANSVLDGLKSADRTKVTQLDEFSGEAKFIRAFCYFYLVNLYGDVPLLTTSDYKINSAAKRNSTAEVYNQIIADLTDAKNLMSSDFSLSNGDKGRPNRWAASALLARVYLYNGKYAQAESEATSLMQNTSLFSLENDLNKIFLKNSSEAIWQLIPQFGPLTNDAQNFIFLFAPYNVALSNTLINSFEAGDKRKLSWTNSYSDATGTYYYAFKYKNNDYSAPMSEYEMVLRLAEVYLIRAEARAMQGNITGAGSDLNILRTRAGLPNTVASSKSQMMAAIEHERQVELFTEWGHRWFDLKREPGFTDPSISRADEVLPTTKKVTWFPYDKLYPIPQSQFDADPNMAGQQNPGYH